MLIIGENYMTMRFDKNNIVDYLHNFNKNCIRQSKHSNVRHKQRELFFEDTNKFLSEEIPTSIEQQDSKKFSLTYDYDDKHNFYIVIAIKDKFINIVTQHIIDKE